MLFLSIAGFDFDPDVVTEILDIAPSWIARKGEVLRDGQLRQTNQWRREACSNTMASGADHEDALGIVTSLLLGREAAFAELRKRVDPRSVEIWGTLDVDAYQSKVWLDPSSMKLLPTVVSVGGWTSAPEFDP
jgi:hypothetical protein